jgi:ATP-dependent helicase IRC3
MYQNEFENFLTDIEPVVDAPFTMRPYQSECVMAMRHALNSGVSRQLAVLPTASGKTVMFVTAQRQLNMPTMLILAHREELINQSAAKVRQISPDLKVGIEKADYSASDDCQVVVASVPTLGRTNSRKRLERFPKDYFSMIVVDECHHAGAKTYLNILRYFEPELLLGVTATPMRGDGIDLANIFDEIVYQKTIPELIEEGERDARLGPYLSRIRGSRITTDVDLRHINIRAGEFAEGELALAVNVDARNSKIISAVEQHFTDRKSIMIFCADRKHTETLCQQFNDRGHDAVYVLGNTEDGARADRVKEFHDGKARIMLNCAVFTEGTDIPRIDGIVLARPVLSPVLYMQMIGRGLRPFPGKEYCHIMDVVDCAGRANVRSIGDAFGVRGVDFLKEDVYEKAKIVRQAMDMGVNVFDDDDINDVERRADVVEKVVKGTVRIETRAQFIDILDAAAVAQEIENSSKFPWIKIHNNLYILSMPDRTVTELQCNALGEWSIHHQNNRNVLENYTKDEPPFKWADKNIKEIYPESWRMKRIDAKWRTAPATATQIQLLRNRFRVMIIPAKFSKGAASDLIDYLINFAKKVRELRRDETGKATAQVQKWQSAEVQAATI